MEKQSAPQLLHEIGDAKRKIAENEKKRKEINDRYHNLLAQYRSGALTKDEYEQKIKIALENRSPEQWLKYYDEYISHHKKRLKESEAELAKLDSVSKKRGFIMILVAILILLAAAFTVWRLFS
jgi:hypothetical protein